VKKEKNCDSKKKEMGGKNLGRGNRRIKSKRGYMYPFDDYKEEKENKRKGKKRQKNLNSDDRLYFSNSISEVLEHIIVNLSSDYLPGDYLEFILRFAFSRTRLQTDRSNFRREAMMRFGSFTGTFIENLRKNKNLEKFEEEEEEEDGEKQREQLMNELYSFAENIVENKKLSSLMCTDSEETDEKNEEKRLKTERSGTTYAETPKGIISGDLKSYLSRSSIYSEEEKYNNTDKNTKKIEMNRLVRFATSLFKRSCFNEGLNARDVYSGLMYMSQMDPEDLKATYELFRKYKDSLSDFKMKKSKEEKEETDRKIIYYKSVVKELEEEILNMHGNEENRRKEEKMEKENAEKLEEEKKEKKEKEKKAKEEKEKKEKEEKEKREKEEKEKKEKREKEEKEKREKEENEKREKREKEEKDIRENEIKEKKKGKEMEEVEKLLSEKEEDKEDKEEEDKIKDNVILRLLNRKSKMHL